MFGKKSKSSNSSEPVKDDMPIRYMSGYLEESGRGAYLPKGYVGKAKDFHGPSDEFYRSTRGNYTAFERRDQDYIILVSHDCREAMYLWDTRKLPTEEERPTCRLDSSMLEAARRRANSVQI